MPRALPCTLYALLCWAMLATAVDPARKDAPTQIHLSQGDTNGTAITISWVTQEANESVVAIRAGDGGFVEVYGRTPAERYSFVAARHAEPYVSGLIHRVTVEGLEPDTAYTYRCGSPDGGWSAAFNFSTPPRPSSTSSVAFAVLGDLGQSPYSALVMEEMLADRSLQSLVVLGDLAYADMPMDPQRWDSWFEMWQPLFATMPIMTVPGNHEVESVHHVTQAKFMAYTKRLHMPSSGRLFYSYNFGPVHFLMLNSHEDFGEESDQYAFVKRDLAAVDRHVTPWVVAAFHAPWYHSNAVHPWKHRHQSEPLEYLLYAGEVDVVFTGHVHSYERTGAVFNCSSAPGAPIYITVGTGGTHEGPATGFYPQPEWSEFRLEGLSEPTELVGHGRVDVANATHLHFRWRSLSGDDTNVEDAVWLVKNSALEEDLLRGVATFPGEPS